MSCATRIIALRTELTARGLDAGPVDHRLASRARGPAGPVDLDHPAHPPRCRAGRARAAQAPAQLVDPLRGRGAQRAVAVRLHPLAPGRRQRGRDHQLARRPLPLPARLHGLPAGRAATTWWPRSPRPATPTAGRPPRSPTTGRSTPPASPAAATASSTCSPTSASARRTARPAIPRPRARSSASTRPSSAGSGAAGGAGPGRAAGPARRLPPRLQRAAATPGDRPGHARRGIPARHPGAPAAAWRRGPLPAPLRPSPTARARMTLRRAGRLHHLKVGAAHARRRVLAIVDEQEVTRRRPRHRRDPLDPPHRARQAATGATNDETPADGRGLKRPADHIVSPMSRLMCRRCRDSRHVSPPRGFEPLISTLKGWRPGLYSMGAGAPEFSKRGRANRRCGGPAGAWVRSGCPRR